MTVHIYVSLFIFLRGLIVFSSKRKHLLLILLSLEFVVISLYLGIYLFLSFINYEFFFLIVFLSIRVCEGALGLSILVMIIRTYGNDYILTFSSL